MDIADFVQLMCMRKSSKRNHGRNFKSGFMLLLATQKEICLETNKIKRKYLQLYLQQVYLQTKSKDIFGIDSLKTYYC